MEIKEFNQNICSKIDKICSNNQKIKTKISLQNDLSKHSKNNLDKLITENQNLCKQTKMHLEEYQDKFPSLDRINLDRLSQYKTQLNSENEILIQQIKQKQLIRNNPDSSFVKREFQNNNSVANHQATNGSEASQIGSIAPSADNTFNDMSINASSMQIQQDNTSRAKMLNNFKDGFNTINNIFIDMRDLVDKHQDQFDDVEMMQVKTNKAATKGNSLVNRKLKSATKSHSNYRNFILVLIVIIMQQMWRIQSDYNRK